ncbi:MAG TPA: hypothetical protein VGP72_19090 [Planctomycetota bacterium]|jgi:DNA-directed RNA polymerase subunit RPC12/RpoP
MSETIVVCAGCGKRYKGTPGERKFRCTTCNNLLTFPPSARSANPNRLLCSNCWSDLERTADLSACPYCQQRVSLDFGGQALAGNHGQADAGDEHAQIQAARRQLEAKNLELQAQLAESQAHRTRSEEQFASRLREAEEKSAKMLSELGSARAELDQANAQTQAAQAQLEQFRAAAVVALEPLVQEFATRMSITLADVATLQSKIQDTRQELCTRLDSLDRVCSQLEQRLCALDGELGQHLNAVLGCDVPTEQSCAQPAAPPASQPNESTPAQDDQPATSRSAEPSARRNPILTTGPLKELLAAGIAPSNAVVVLRHDKTAAAS